VAHQRQSGGKKMFIAVLTLFIQEVPPQYNWTIVESGIKHQKHSPNPIQEVVQLIFVSVRDWNIYITCQTLFFVQIRKQTVSYQIMILTSQLCKEINHMSYHKTNLLSLILSQANMQQMLDILYMYLLSLKE
jgi:hypothetical protein